MIELTKMKKWIGAICIPLILIASPKTYSNGTIESDTVRRSSKNFIIVDKINNTFTGNIPLMYEWRKIQVGLDSSMKREIYRQNIINKKDQVIEELKNSDHQKDIILAVKDQQIIRKDEIIVEQKEKIKKKNFTIIGSVALNIVLAFLFLR